MQTQHTPGPWTAFKDMLGKWHVDHEDGHCIIQGEKAEANARLIAAAPELLAALQNLLDADMTSESAIKVVHNARIAIAKAKGE